MEAIIIAFIVVIAAYFIGGPLGWGIVLTAILYFVFETVSSNIQKSHQKMRKEMDLILNKNLESQKLIQESLDKDDESDEDESDADVTTEEKGGEENKDSKSQTKHQEAVQSVPGTLSDAQNDANNKQENNDELVNRVDAAADVLNALDERQNETL